MSGVDVVQPYVTIPVKQLNEVASSSSVRNQNDGTSTSEVLNVTVTGSEKTSQSHVVHSDVGVTAISHSNNTSTVSNTAVHTEPNRNVTQEVDKDKAINELPHSNNNIIHPDKQEIEMRASDQTVSSTELSEALLLMKYDIHRELQVIMREQVRQFAIAKVTKICNSSSVRKRSKLISACYRHSNTSLLHFLVRCGFFYLFCSF